MATQTEIAAMRRAIALAAQALGATAPNPVVGCVVLDVGGEVAGVGWHRRAGTPHAEIHALTAAGDRARGGTAVVTLEPCNHTGRTGPCSSALIEAGVARVVYAVDDPDPHASGGAAALRDAGVVVESGVLAAEARAGNVAWLTAVRRGRPYVRWKYAATLDGRVAAADGTSRWISSTESRRDAHRLRAEADAVVVGAGTVRTDDPRLTVRDVEHAVQPLRVVVTASARLPRTAHVLDGTVPTLVVVGLETDTAALEGVDVARVPCRTPGLDPAAVLSELYARGVRSVLLEGGPTLAGAFVAASVVDAVTGYLAPALLGDGPPSLRGAGVATIADMHRLAITEVARLGPDLRVIAEPTPCPEG